jgi:hypothetical protein
VAASKKLRSGRYARKIIYPLFVFGAFVWEDMLVFSVFWTISSLILWYLNNFKLTLVLVLLFVIFRGFGEMVYSLLGQFVAKHHRPYDFGFAALSDESIYILYQVAELSIVTLAAFCLYLIICFL